MSSTNLWGDVDTAGGPTPPATILRQQAAKLGELTENVLEGRVGHRTSDGLLIYSLDIVAPALDNYSYTVLEIRYPITLYPVLVMPATALVIDARQCENEQEFIHALASALQSPQVGKVIAALIAQSKE